MIPIVCNALQMGLPLTGVAGLIGVTRNTFMRWLTEGQDENCKDELKVELAVRVYEARAKAALEGVKMMNLHAAEDYRAQLELLRAQDPETWAPKAQTKIDVEVSQKPQRDLSLLTDSELEDLARLEAKIQAAKALPA